MKGVQPRLSRLNILITNAVSFQSFHGYLTTFLKSKVYDPVPSLFFFTVGIDMAITVLSHLSEMGEIEATLSFLGLTWIQQFLVT